MAKNLKVDNPMLTPVIPLRRPSIEPAEKSENMCSCGCGEYINRGMDSYIEIDDMIFDTDYCVTNYFIKAAGGRRVYGGAC